MFNRLSGVFSGVVLRSVVAVAAVVALQGAWADPAASTEAAAANASTAHSVVEQVTTNLVSVVRSERKLLDTDPEVYFAKVKSVLEPVVDFGYIARNVMGPHGKAATPEQRKRFEETFKDSLVETYAKGMANYVDLDIKVLPPSKDVSGERRVGVVQEITGPDGTNRVSYTMAQNREGEWKLINMVLNGVNLGKTFRNQFVQAVKQNDGNIDAVINTWSAES